MKHKAMQWVKQLQGPQLKTNCGQTSLPEYVLLLFIVVACAVAMAVYSQRAVQARMFDARNYAINQVRSECDQDCLKAIGAAGIAREYEPYYGSIVSNVDRKTEDMSFIEGGVSRVDGVYSKFINQQTAIKTHSYQRPPKEAN